MPLKTEHLTKAQANEGFANSLDLTVHPNVDWALTALFYSALHYVEAYFATRNRHSVDHRARDSAIQRDPNLQGIYDHYSDLKNFSINARYFVSNYSELHVNQVRPSLQQIRSHIYSLF